MLSGLTSSTHISPTIIATFLQHISIIQTLTSYLYSNLKHKFLLLSPPYLGLLIHLYIFQRLHKHFHRRVYICIMFEFSHFLPFPSLIQYIQVHFYFRNYPSQNLSPYRDGNITFCFCNLIFFANWFIFHPNPLPFLFTYSQQSFTNHQQYYFQHTF